MKSIEQVSSVPEALARLEHWRVEAGLKAVELCSRAGIGPATYSSWLGRRNEAGWRIFTAAALALGKTPNDLQLRDPSKPELGRERSPADQAARRRIMAVLDRLEGEGKGFAKVTADFLEGVADELLGKAALPEGTQIAKDPAGVKLYSAPEVVKSFKRRGKPANGGAAKSGETAARYGKRKRRG